MKRSMLLILALATALLPSCSGNRKSVRSGANAVDTFQMRYPSDFYIVRTGHGETPEEAAENARFEIVKFFESRISGETTLVQTAKSAITRGKLLEDRLTELTSTVSITGARDIPGIEIVPTEKPDSRGIYEARAVLSKQDYASYLGDKIAGLDASIDHRLQETGASDDDLANARALATTAREIAERETYRRDQALVAGQSAKASREALFAQVTASLDSLIANALDVGVVFSDQVDAKIRPGIVKGLTDAGIRIREFGGMSAASTGGSDLIVSVAVTATPRTTETTIGNRKETLFWSDWILSLTAVDPESKQVIDTVVLSDRISGRDAAQANDRMVRRIMDTQTPAIAAWIYEVVFAGNKK